MNYGYCRISRKTQNIDRQVRNILKVFPETYIIKEVFTGTRLQGRKELDKLINIVKEGDTIIFDSASRMSRCADEAMELYEEMFYKGVNLIFLKEPHINTETYRNTLNNQIEINLDTGNEATDVFISGIIEALNRFTIELAKQQIKLVFQQAEKEVQDLRQRTAEGLLTAKINNKQIGNIKGCKLTTKKSIKAKEQIKKYSKDFDGSLNDIEVMKLVNVAKNTYYKYKKELIQMAE